MYPSLEAKLKRYQELEQQIQDPAVLTDTGKMLQIQREMGGLSRVAKMMLQFQDLGENLETAKLMVVEEQDPAAKAYAEEELQQYQQEYDAIKSELEDMLTAGDAATRGSLIMEIRAGTGGEEAALFARDLFNMYSRYVETQGWKMEIMEMGEAEMGGLKEVVMTISGEGAFMNLQFESGGHRVQRVPETETQGRVHTSAATVAVLPEATEVDVEIKDEDLRIDTMRAGGPGGQKVNKTESAIRITHIPSGLVVKIQDEKSQHKNKAKALRVLRSRLLEMKTEEQHEARADTRRTLIGSGNRNERIRTYNFPQNRLTDHRIGLTLYKLDNIMQGNLDELIVPLKEFDRQERLKGLSETN